MQKINNNDAKKLFDEEILNFYKYTIKDSSIDEEKSSTDEHIREVIEKLQLSRKLLLGEEIYSTLSLNGNIYPDDVYEYISKAAQRAITFKYNKTMLSYLINNCDDEEYIALIPMDIAMLVINTDSNNKEVYSDEEKQILELIFETAQSNPVFSGKDARKLLEFIESRKLLVEENTDLFNRYINSSTQDCELDYLFIDKRTKENNYHYKLDNKDTTQSHIKTKERTRSI